MGVIEAGLKCIQGKGIVNSISMKEGEAKFSSRPGSRAATAPVIVMAFDETGQADTFARKTEICAARLQAADRGRRFPAEDIIFDPNIFAVATGIEEHDNYAVDFIEPTAGSARTCRTRWSPAASPTSASRSAATTRCARRSHRVPLPRDQGRLTMGIVNAGSSASTTRRSRSCASASRT